MPRLPLSEAIGTLRLLREIEKPKLNFTPYDPESHKKIVAAVLKSKEPDQDQLPKIMTYKPQQEDITKLCKWSEDLKKTISSMADQKSADDVKAEAILSSECEALKNHFKKYEKITDPKSAEKSEALIQVRKSYFQLKVRQDAAESSISH